MAIFVENNINFKSPEVTVDDLLGQMLHTIGISYFYHVGYENEIYAKNLQLEKRHNPVEAMVTHSVDVKYFFGLPRVVSEGGIRIDVDKNVNSIFLPTQDKERLKAFMLLSGLSSSAWENKILEVFFNIPSVSSVKLLKLASKQGMPIYTIDSVNQGDILPQLSLDSDVKNDIINAVSIGKKVIVHKDTLVYNKWKGAGYIVLNPDTGAAGYMISGGLAGGGSSSPPSSSVRYPLPQRPQPLVEPTIFLRKVVLDFARAYMGTPYVWGGKTENPGFDCSGFVHAVYAEATSPLIGKKLNTNAAGQYSACAANKWQQPFEERLPGDIIWRSNLKHVGIEAGVNEVVWPLNSSNTFIGETVVHASGRPCYQSSEDAPKGTPPGCIRSDCILINPSNPRQGGNPSCGSFNAVIESPVKYFAKDIAENVCRPH